MSRRVGLLAPELPDAAAAKQEALLSHSADQALPSAPAASPKIRSPGLATGSTEGPSVIPLPLFGATGETECPRCGISMQGSTCPLCLFEEQDNVVQRARERLQSAPSRVQINALPPPLNLVSSAKAAVARLPADMTTPASTPGTAADAPTPTQLRTWIGRPRSRSSPPPSIYGGRLSPDEADLFYIPPSPRGQDASRQEVGSSSHVGSASSHSTPSPSLAHSHGPGSSPPSTVHRFHPTFSRLPRHRHTRSRSAHIFDSMNSVNASPSSRVLPPSASRALHLLHLRARPSISRDDSASVSRYDFAHTHSRSNSTNAVHITAPSSPEPRPDAERDFDPILDTDGDVALFAQPVPDVAYLSLSPSTPSDTDYRSPSPPAHLPLDPPAMIDRSLAPADTSSLLSAVLDSSAVVVVPRSPSPRSPKISIPSPISLPSSPSVGIIGPISSSANTVLASPSLRRPRPVSTSSVASAPLSPPPTGPLPDLPTAPSPRVETRAHLLSAGLIGEPGTSSRPVSLQLTTNHSPTNPTFGRHSPAREAPPSSPPKYDSYIARKGAEQDARMQRLAALAAAAEAEVHSDSDREAGMFPRERAYASDSDALHLRASRVRGVSQFQRDGEAPPPGALAMAHLSLAVPASGSDRRQRTQSVRSSKSVPGARTIQVKVAYRETEAPGSPNSPNAKVEFGVSPSRSSTSNPKRLSATSKRYSGGSSGGGQSPASKRLSMPSFASRSRKNSTRSGTSSAHTRNLSSQYTIPIPPVPVPERPRPDSDHDTTAPSHVSRHSGKVREFFRRVGRVVAGKPTVDDVGLTDTRLSDNDALEQQDTFFEAEPRRVQSSDGQSRRRAYSTFGEAMLVQTEPPPPPPDNGRPKRSRSIVDRVRLDRGRSRSHDLLRSTDTTPVEHLVPQAASTFSLTLVGATSRAAPSTAAGDAVIDESHILQSPTRTQKFLNLFRPRRMTRA